MDKTCSRFEVVNEKIIDNANAIASTTADNCDGSIEWFFIFFIDKKYDMHVSEKHHMKIQILSLKILSDIELYNIETIKILFKFFIYS